MKVSVIMGSKSDKDVVKEAVDILEEFGVEVDWRILSAHRTPDEAHTYATGMKGNGTEVCICAAGKAAHLAGVFASGTTIPVIGLPIKSSTMDGLDSLLSTVQMPGGIPVATVAINGGKNAGLLALEILSIKYDAIADKLSEYKVNMKNQILKDDEELRG